MAKKRYNHPYVDGELVRDLQHKETIVFMDVTCGWRAQTYPKLMRAATKEEKEAFSEYRQPTRP